MKRAVSDKILSMHILTVIHRRPGINTEGRTIYRIAVRGGDSARQKSSDDPLFQCRRLQISRWRRGGRETRAQALSREIQEECGTSLTRIGRKIGAVIEYNLPIKDNYDVFKMTSHYYECEVSDSFGPQKLDGYEQELHRKT